MLTGGVSWQRVKKGIQAGPALTGFVTLRIPHKLSFFYSETKGLDWMRFKVSFSAEEFILETQTPLACPTCKCKRVTDSGQSLAWEFELLGSWLISLDGFSSLDCVIRSVSGTVGLVGISGTTD